MIRKARMMTGWPLVALLTLLILSVGFQGKPARAASTPAASFDSALFFSSVPSYAILGHNYTVKVLVTNNLNMSTQVLVRVDAPVGAVYTWPLLQHQSLGPMEETIFNFTLVAFGGNSGKPMNVTAMLWIWPSNSSSTPQLVQTANKAINGVSPSQQAVATVAVLLVGAVVVLGLSVARHLRRNRTKNNRETTTQPLQPLPRGGHHDP